MPEGVPVPLHVYRLYWVDFAPLPSRPEFAAMPSDLRVGRWLALSRTGRNGQSVATCRDGEADELKQLKRANAYDSLNTWLRGSTVEDADA